MTDLVKDYAKIIDDLREENKDLREKNSNQTESIKNYYKELNRLALETHQLRKYQEEDQKIEQILGKALGYPWYKDDPDIFPKATEADGVCVGVETAWSLAMIAADKIKELEEKIKNATTLEIKIIDNIFCYKENKKSHIFDGNKCSACGVSQWVGREYFDHHSAII
jgi:hypothetical protein